MSTATRLISDGITPDLDRIAGQLRNKRPLMAALGKQLQVDLRAHFMDRDSKPNKRGFPRKHFWRKAVAMHTALTEVAEHSATVTIDSPELMHKITGGTITPQTARALSIPLSPEAYRAGRARLFPRPLTMVVRPGKPPLLVETGVIGKAKSWKLHYVLLKSVTHAADPRALPEPGTLQKSLLVRAREHLDRVLGVS